MGGAMGDGLVAFPYCDAYWIFFFHVVFIVDQMIAATAVCGMIYAAFSGQPLTIIGSTGPVLAFIAVLYKTAIRLVSRPRMNAFLPA